MLTALIHVSSPQSAFAKPQKTSPKKYTKTQSSSKSKARYAFNSNRSSATKAKKTIQPEDQGVVLNPPKISNVDFTINSRGQVYLPQIPNLQTTFADKVIGQGENGEHIFYTVNPELQRYAEQLVKGAKSAHVAVIAIEPESGKILAMAEKSNTLPNALQHAGFPAASLFKVVTSAAALENSPLNPYSTIHFRGGKYTLNKYNYTPNARLDRSSMNLSEALGYSCNPVFGRVALEHLNRDILFKYARAFGFNQDLGFDVPTPESSASIPGDGFGLSRTAAGFGNVFMSPIHAAAFASVPANKGKLIRPHLVDRILDKNGNLMYQARPQVLRTGIQADTAASLLQMMHYSTTQGTSKYAFYSRGKSLMTKNVPVAGKTGTLSGTNPRGLNRWFIAAAPLNNPKIALAIIAISPGNTASRPSYMGRLLLDRYLTSASSNPI